MVNDRSRLRLVILSALVLSLPVTLIGRLWYMQALAGDEYTAQLNKTITREVNTLAPRGLIVDDVGNPLAANSSALVVSALSTELPKANLGTTEHPKPNPKRVDEFDRLAKILGVPASTLEAKATLCDYATYHEDAPKKNPGCWTGSPLQPIPLVTLDNSTPDAVKRATDVALQVLEQQELFPGITAQVQDVRAYPAPQGASAAQILGHVGKITSDDIDNAKGDAEKAALKSQASAGGLVGQAGLESEYNSYLEGKMGTKTVSVDPAGNPISTLSEVAPVPGDSVVTSIDAKAQKIAEQALADGIQRARTVPQRIMRETQTVPADAGAAVVIDLRTGHVIALANYPTYDPGVWDGSGIDDKTYKELQDNPGKPLFSQAIQGQYAPGSTFKVITTAAAVSTPYYSLSGTYDCASVFKLGNITMTNFEGESGQGSISFAQALKISCDTFFYQVGDTLWRKDGGINPKSTPADAVIKQAEDWGLGKSTGIDLPIDGTGSIETREDTLKAFQKNGKLWCVQATTAPDPVDRAYAADNCSNQGHFTEGEAVNMAIGQGTVTVTPLQLAMAYAALGNGGTLFSPRIAKAIIGPDGKVVKNITAPSTKLKVPPDVLAYEQQALQTVISGGTAAAAFQGFPLDQYSVGGKTGTAEVEGKMDTAWFASFGGPANGPAQYAVVAMVSQGGQGGVTAAPVVREIYDGLFGLDGISNPAATYYMAHDKYAAAGPAMPNGAPPSTLPNLMPGATPGASASSPAASASGASASGALASAASAASASASSAVNGALLALGAVAPARPPDDISGPPSAAWAR